MTNATIRTIKLNFAGTELDAIVGHPDHELLFVARQVAEAAGLKVPKQAAYSYAKQVTSGVLKVRALDSNVTNLVTLKTSPRWLDAWLFTEPAVYQMLLRGHAPQSEPFRKWVTEEVLPSIRKTGQYDLSKSNSAEGKQLAEEFGKLRTELQLLTSEVAGLKELIAGLKVTTAGSVPSPYEGTTRVPVCDKFDSKVLRDVADSMGINAATANKIAARACVEADNTLYTLWKHEDKRELLVTASTRGRQWVMYPKNWLDSKMTRSLYRELISRVLEAAL